MPTTASAPQNCIQRRVTILINAKLISHLLNYKASLISARLWASWGRDSLVCLSCRALIMLWVLTANKTHVNPFWCGFLPLQTREESHAHRHNLTSPPNDTLMRLIEKTSLDRNRKALFLFMPPRQSLWLYNANSWQNLNRKYAAALWVIKIMFVFCLWRALTKH